MRESERERQVNKGEREREREGGEREKSDCEMKINGKL